MPHPWPSATQHAWARHAPGGGALCMPAYLHVLSVRGLGPRPVSAPLRPPCRVSSSPTHSPTARTDAPCMMHPCSILAMTSMAVELPGASVVARTDRARKAPSCHQNLDECAGAGLSPPTRAEKSAATGRWSEKRDSPRAYQRCSIPSPRHRMRSHLPMQQQHELAIN